MTIIIKSRYKRRIRLKRKGQSEIIGGLIVLTLLFAFAIPLMINVYYSTIQTSEQAQQAFQQLRTQYNEKITVTPLDPNNEAYIRAGWIPGVFINNTGTTQVTLVKLYILDTETNNIYTILDLRYARPNPVTPLIKYMLVNVTLPGTGQPPPPAGEPITLMPGESLLISFNESLLPYPSNLVVLVESSTGVIHPIIGQGGAEPLYPGRGAGTSLSVGQGAWRGIFSPQSGFILRGAEDLEKAGISYTWTPPLRVVPYKYSSWSGWYVSSFDFYTSFIYDDPLYPGLYYLYIIPAETFYISIYDRNTGNSYIITVDSGDVLEIRGFLGTYDTGPDTDPSTYFSGYAYMIKINGIVYYVDNTTYNLGTRGITTLDFDSNGVDEVAFYSYLNGPSVTTPTNYDSDGDGYQYYDANAWTYIVGRDISGVNYVKVTVKVNYYWTQTFSGSCPDWNYRKLKIFAIVVWKYDNTTGGWDIYQYQAYSYTNIKPLQFQKTAVFPLNSNGVYRIGLIFFDNYRDWDGYGYSCFTDFTYSLEHLIVEYGIYNPIFVESPPLYMIAIPDANYISDIGETDLALAYNITDINTAKVLAQKTLLNKLIEELNYAGVSGYTIITNATDACNLLFSNTPPRYAVIYWLQGAVPLSDVLPCLTTEEDALEYIIDNHWILVSPFGTPFGGETNLQYYNTELNLLPEGNYTANITDVGIEYRQKAYAFYLFNTVQFKTLAYISPAYDYLYVANGTFYTNTSGLTEYYGTSSFWVYNPIIGGGEGTGMIVINPVHIDWDYTRDGAVVDTVVQQIVYSSLSAWRYLISNY